MKPSISDVHCLLPNVVDPFGMCPDPDKEIREQQEYEDNLKEIQSDILQLRAEKDVIMEQVNKKVRKILEKENQLKSICKHEEVEKESRYFAGSYYDQAYTDTRLVCTRCATATEWKRETHSWYG